MPNKYPTSSSTVHNRYIGSGGFKGVDFTSSPAFVSPERFSDAKNVYKDYRNGLGACVETFPGFRTPLRFAVYDEIGGFDSVKIHGMLVWHVNGSAGSGSASVSNEDVVAIHAGTRLYIVPLRSVESKPFGRDNPSTIFFPRSPSQYADGIDYLGAGDGTTSTFYCAAFGEDDEATDFKSFVSHYNFLPDNPCKMFAEDGDLFILAEEGYFRVRLKSGSFNTGEKTTSQYLFHAEHIVKKREMVWQGADPFTIYDGKYIPTTYINNEAYEQPNLIGDEFSELFTEPTIREEITEEDGQGKGIYRYCTLYPSNKAHFFYDGNFIDKTNFGGSKITIRIDGKTIFEAESPTAESKYAGITVRFKYNGDLITEKWGNELNEGDDPRAYFDEIEISQYFMRNNEGGIVNNGVDILKQGSEIRITCDGQTDVPSAILDEFDGKPAEAILGCKVVEHHDGRIFFAGNPKLPNVVFYTQRNLNGKNEPTYVGAQNYFRVGGEGTPVTSMVSTSSALIIFKKAGVSGEEASVYYASGVTTEADIIPRVYTVTQGAVGVGCTSKAINFADDICFASQSGIYGLNRLQTNLERSIMSRSRLIDGRFVSEDTDVLLCEWEGYLCVYCKSGHMYLADSRQLSSEGYEWYYVEDIGHYSGTQPAEITDMSVRGQTVYDESGAVIGVANPSVLGGGPRKTGYLHQTIGDNEVIKIPCQYYDAVGTGKVRVVLYDGEKVGGTFSPATTMITVGDSIWYGADGYLLVLNSDMRGVPNGDDDAGVEPMRIRSKWYTHSGKRYESYVVTHHDDAGVPNLAKSTVNRSTVIDMKTIPGSAFKVSVYTERDGWISPAQSTASIPDYSETDFAAVNFSGGTHTVVTLKEHTNRWSRKMYRVYSNEFCRPFGIHRISYQFKVAGRIKD